MEKNLKDLLIAELQDILSSEEQIIEALPEMAKAADSSELKNAFESHLKETRRQIQRLEKIFKFLKIEKKAKFCKATKGLVEEWREVLKDFKTKSPLRDAALISKAQRVEHYEISAYGTARTFASELDLNVVESLLQETFEEEENADQLLSKIAEGGLFKSGINHQAKKLQKDVFIQSDKIKISPKIKKGHTSKLKLTLPKKAKSSTTKKHKITPKQKRVKKSKKK